VTPSRNELLALYHVAIDEYRFQVKLNWDRTVYYLTLNSGFVAIATSLLKSSNGTAARFFVAALFFIGFCTALLGILAIQKGHEYYRRTVVKKTLIEDYLGLTAADDKYTLNFAIGTTEGQEDLSQILNNTSFYLKHPQRKTSITSTTQAILAIFCVVDVLGMTSVVWL
jgi:hypothetical protein